MKSDIEKSLTDGCLDVIRRCLDPNPKTRINMEELADHPWIMHKMFVSDKKPEKEKIKVIAAIKEEPAK
jgi:serine/threonine protein kinase